MYEFESVFKHAGVGMAMVAPDGLIIRANAALHKFLETTPGSLNGRHFKDITHPYDIEKDVVLFDQLVSGEIPTYSIEKRYLTPTGPHWGLLTVSAVRDSQGNIMYVISQVQDIHQIKEANNRFDALTGSIPEVFYINRFIKGQPDSLEMEFVSPAYEAVWGKSAVSLMKNPQEWVEAIVPADKERVSRLFTECLTSASNFEVEYRIERPDGKIVWIRDKGHVCRLNGYHQMAGIAEDITKLKEANAYLKEFAYIASHDLKEPLRIIQGYGELLEDLGENLDEDISAYVGHMKEAAHRMGKMVDGLLAYSRAMRNEKAADVDLNDVVNQVQSNLKHAIMDASPTIEVGNLPKVHGSESQLLRLLQNLLSNAIKYRKPNTRAKIQITHKESVQGFHIISVKDNGIGINPRYHARIFQLFKRLHTNKVYEGLGIGLAVCKQIVDQQGGEIWLTSEEDNGCEFFVKLLKSSQELL